MQFTFDEEGKMALQMDGEKKVASKSVQKKTNNSKS